MRKEQESEQHLYSFPRRQEDEPEGARSPSDLPVRKRRRSPVTRFTLALMGLIVLFTLYLSQYAVVAYYSHRVGILEQEINSISHENQELQRQMRELGSLERIERIAREELDMMPAQDVRYVHLQAGSEPGVDIAADEIIQDHPGVFLRLQEWWEANLSVQARE